MKTLSALTALVLVVSTHVQCAGSRPGDGVIGEEPALSASPYTLGTNVGVEPSLLAAFDANTEAFFAALRGLSQAEWTFRENPDRWSIAEIAEHIILAEAFLLHTIDEQVLATPPRPSAASKGRADTDRFIASVVRDRSQRVTTVDALRPAGQFATANDAAEAFTEARTRTVTYLAETDKDLRAHEAEHPIGRVLDGHQWFLFMVGHVDRHLTQIAQVKGHPDFGS